MQAELKALKSRVSKAEEGLRGRAGWAGRQNKGNHPVRTADRKQRKRHASNERDPWENTEQANPHTLGIPEGEGTGD